MGKPINNTTINPKKIAIASKTEELLSDDDFIPQKKAIKQFVDLSSSEDEIYTQNKTSQLVNAKMLPDSYDYKFIEIFEYDHAGSYHCTFRLKVAIRERCEELECRLVYERSKTQCGKQVIKKLYSCCQHNQRQTGKHTKSVLI